MPNDALHVETGSEGPVTGVGDFSRDYVAREMDDVYVYDEMYASTFPSTAILPHALSTIHPSRITHAQTYDSDHIWVLRCS